MTPLMAHADETPARRDGLIHQPVSRLKGVGPRLERRLAQIGVHSVCDLLHCLPIRYQDRTRLTAIEDMKDGIEYCFWGQILRTEVRYGRRRSLLCTVNDGTGELRLRFFHFRDGQRRSLSAGLGISGFGTARRTRAGLEMGHPEYTLTESETQPKLPDSLTPIYPTTEGLGQTTLRKLVGAAFTILDQSGPLPDPLPPRVREQFGLIGLTEALQRAHRPHAGDDRAHEGSSAVRRRLSLDELVANHIGLRRLRARLDQRPAAKLAIDESLSDRFMAGLDFKLTGAQHRAADEIRRDLARDRPMHRLLQGDVGSGKTVVAALAAVQACANGQQTAIMAPTELLAEQHLANLRSWFAPLSIDVGWLSAATPAPDRRRTLDGLRTGTVQLVVGTHALVQDSVRFARLGLAIIDEQHRFGVDQRLRLSNNARSEGVYPHVLIMTATPIPRTLAMVAFADLDTSVLDERPPGRQPVNTVAIPLSRRDQVIERTAAACRSGQRAYWVCPLVETSDELDCQSAIDTAQELQARLPDIRISLVHGRLSAADKENAMRAFKSGDSCLLVATTVVEVGVDVPEATIMVVESAERFGLSQLHQLRGRVGRGNQSSACVLLYEEPLSDRARQRLQALRDSNDGFEVAQRDLELRGPGELLGVRQAGSVVYRYADLNRDRDLLPLVEKIGSQLMRDYPEAAGTLTGQWSSGRDDYPSA